MERKSVILVDDHPILATGIKNMIESLDQYKVDASATSAETALEIMAKNIFDILVADYELPGMNGLDEKKKKKKMQTGIKIIVLSMHDDPSVIKEIIKEGVDGYVLKKDTHHSLLSALERVERGKRYLSDEVSEILMQNMDESEESQLLTPRETEIVKLIAEDYSNKEIAEKLFISERTVETHRKNILRKTGTSSAIGLLKWAREHGVL